MLIVLWQRVLEIILFNKIVFLAKQKKKKIGRYCSVQCWESCKNWTATLENFAANGDNTEIRAFYGFLIGFCLGTHEALLSDTCKFETVDKSILQQNMDYKSCTATTF